MQYDDEVLLSNSLFHNKKKDTNIVNKRLLNIILDDKRKELNHHRNNYLDFGLVMDDESLISPCINKKKITSL